MTVVTLVDYTPLPRYDGKPWTSVVIEEAESETGPWTEIDMLTLTPVDADPSQPNSRNFTTHNAMLDEGWYTVTFLDEAGGQLPTDPVHNVADITAPYLPLVSAVGGLIMSRTKDEYGNELGTFTGKTRPNYTQVKEIIDQAADDVTTYIDTDIPAGAYDYVQQAIALRAAMIIERGYFAEQINTNRSPYMFLRDDYDRLMGTPEHPGEITKMMERETGEDVYGEEPMINKPFYAFPAADMRLSRPT